jgi:hypothetical protein
MNVIWHYDPRSEIIFRAMAEPKRILYQLTNFGSAEVAFPSPFVEVRFQLGTSLSIVFDFQ